MSSCSADRFHHRDTENTEEEHDDPQISQVTQISFGERIEQQKLKRTALLEILCLFCDDVWSHTEICVIYGSFSLCSLCLCGEISRDEQEFIPTGHAALCDLLFAKR
jgi:hypothetical protein